ncbi:hypothetical protein [uncultured Selenomonas sp.]|uniref:hypothetical protein n=1 Tax=uncultured Selenomonas sp. TaxID=159275 RepID=UPI0028DC5BCB|nr:hypothetical protein [uncultured Selenomonas sp.]
MRTQCNKLAQGGVASWGNMLDNMAWAPLWLLRSLLRFLRRSLTAKLGKAE